MTTVFHSSISRHSCLDDEREQIKKLIHPTVAAPIIASLEKTSSLGISSSKGSLAKSNSVSFPQHRPKIEAPQGNHLEDLISYIGQFNNPLYNITRRQIKNDELTALSVSIYESETEINTNLINKVTEKLNTALEEYRLSSLDEKKWGVLHCVLQYFISASSIVLGSTLVATGAGASPGALLIAAGGFGLATQITNDTNAWKNLLSNFNATHKTKERIAGWIETGSFLLSISLSVASGKLALQAGVASIPHISETTLRAISMSSSVMNGGVKLTEGFTKKRTSEVKALITELNAQSADLHQSLQRDALVIQEEQKIFQESGEVTKKAVSELEISSEDN